MNDNDKPEPFIQYEGPDSGFWYCKLPLMLEPVWLSVDDLRQLQKEIQIELACE